MNSGPGIFPRPLSTSNLYAPKQDAVMAYLNKVLTKETERQLFLSLERRLCEYHDAKYCVLFSTGFWALVAAIKLKSLPEKTQVIIPSFTYRRLADVVHWAGLIPVFVDVQVSTLAICPRAIANSINEHTALILAVHPIVNCCDVNEIINVSEQNNIPVIFDAVESVHETYNGRRIGSFGIGEVFSLHASKFINGLEGGYICTDERDYAHALDQFKKGLVTSFNDQSHFGLNGLPNVGHAAFALAGLDELDANVAHNREIYLYYLETLREVDGISLLLFDETEQSSYKNIVVQVTDTFPVSRDKLVDALNQELVLARKYYTPALHTKNYDYPVIIADMKNTNIVENQYVNLPCGARINQGDVSLICDLIRFIANNKRKLHESNGW